MLFTLRQMLFFMWRNSQTWAQAASLLRILDHTQLNTQPVGLLRTSDQLVADAIACTTNRKKK